METVEWSDVINDIPWLNWFEFEWADITPDWRWSAILGGPITFGSVLVFNWSDVLPRWVWSDIIPKFSLKDMHGDHAAEDQLMAQGSRHGQTVAPHSTDEQMRAAGARTAGTSPQQAAYITALLDRNAALGSGPIDFGKDF